MCTDRDRSAAFGYEHRRSFEVQWWPEYEYFIQIVHCYHTVCSSTQEMQSSYWCNTVVSILHTIYNTGIFIFNTTVDNYTSLWYDVVLGMIQVSLSMLLSQIETNCNG